MGILPSPIRPSARPDACPAPRPLQRLRRFARDGSGSAPLEAMFILPLLITAVLTTVVLSEMFRSQNTSLRAAYTVADTLSRRVDPVDAAYINGTAQLYRYLAQAQHGTWLRVSSIAFNPAEDRFIVVWSHHASGGDTLTTETLNMGLHERLPSMPAGETVIMVEAGTQWNSAAQRVLANREFRQVAVTRPRFTPQLRFDNGEAIIFLPGGGGTCDDGNDLCNPGA